MYGLKSKKAKKTSFSLEIIKYFVQNYVLGYCTLYNLIFSDLLFGKGMLSTFDPGDTIGSFKRHK